MAAVFVTALDSVRASERLPDFERCVAALRADALTLKI